MKSGLHVKYLLTLAAGVILHQLTAVSSVARERQSALAGASCKTKANSAALLHKHSIFLSASTFIRLRCNSYLAAKPVIAHFQCLWRHWETCRARRRASSQARTLDSVYPSCLGISSVSALTKSRVRNSSVQVPVAFSSHSTWEPRS